MTDRRALEAELADINAKIDTWARTTGGVDDCPPEALLLRKFEIHQLLRGEVFAPGAKSRFGVIDL